MASARKKCDAWRRISDDSEFDGAALGSRFPQAVLRIFDRADTR